MNIRKAGTEGDIFFWVAVDEKGNRVVYLEDGQNLQKKCDKLIDIVAPGQGQVGHHHKDYNAGDDPFKKAPVKQTVVGQ